MNNEKITKSIANLWLSFISLLKTLYKGMPILMLTFTSLMLILVKKIGSNSTMQIGVLTGIIFISSVVVYIKSKNYGESVLALSAGLFTVYTVTWTVPLFISFSVVWVAFTLIVFLTTSISLGAKAETIYLEASFALKSTGLDEKVIDEKLRSISNKLNNGVLGPIEKAEVLRVFAYKKIPIGDMEMGLKWVNIFFAITRIPYLDLSDFVSIVIKNSSTFNAKITSDRIFDYIYDGMRTSSASPNEYIDLFKQTRHHLIKSKNIILYFDTLSKYFDNGVSSNDIENYFENNLNDIR